MTLLDHINEAVDKILSTRRIGQPVFVRGMVYESPGKNDPAILLLRLADLARNWLGQDLVEVFAGGRVESGPVSLALKCRQGASALLIYAQGRPAADLMILGNHGAIYFDDRSDQWGDDSVAKVVEAAALTAEQNQLLGAIRSSLRSGKPVSVSVGPAR